MGCQSSQATGNAQANMPQAPKKEIKPKGIPDQIGADQYHVVIIGSGIGGMNAAYNLSKSNLKVVVLEAEQYIGGRLRSINIHLNSGSNFAFDYGASWIHGSCNQNPITDLSKKIPGVKMVETLDDQAIIFDLQGNDVTDQANQQSQYMQKILQSIQKGHDTSVYQAIQALDSEKLQNKFFMYNISNGTQFQTSGSIQHLHSSNYADDDQFQGKQMLITSGYQKFPQFLANDGKIKVLLNHKVVSVTSLQEKSQIKCSNGAKFIGYNVVFAVPLGVLKNNIIKCNPQFPGWKKESIEGLQFGNVCKILVDFVSPITSIKKHYIGVIDDDVQKRGLATYFLNIQSFTGIPALMTFGLGGNADEAQQMEQNQIKELIAQRVNVFADKKVTSKDFKIARTSWRTNQNFQGTYTYHGLSTKQSHWKNIAKPIFDQSWYFCGEHTSSKYRGTVHGAYISGQQTAKTIMNEVGEQDWEYFDDGEDDQ